MFAAFIRTGAICKAGKFRAILRRNKSHKFMLKRMGPNIDSWKTPYIIIKKSLKEEPTLVF